MPSFAFLARRPLITAALLILAGVLTTGCGGSRSHRTVAAAQFDQLASRAETVLDVDMRRLTPSDPRYYANGNWYGTNGPSCWYCYDSAAVGAATLGSQRGADPNLKQVAIDTFDTAIAEHQLPDGAFADAGGAADGIGTGFFTVDLGIAYLELRSALPPSTRGRWSAAVEKAADYVIDSGDANWYANGNVTLRQTEVLWLAWSITRLPRFERAYNAEWQFTISPPQRRWPGFGLRITKAPTRSDGSDGAGYLAESGGDTPGFDPSYSDAQLDTATDLWVLTRDPRYLRMMNLLFNQLRPRIGSDWTLNATGGTRKNYMTPFMSPAVSVLATSGDRPQLAGEVSSQLHMIELEYQQSERFTNINFFKGFGSWISMPLLNLQWPGGMAPDTGLASVRSYIAQHRVAHLARVS
jgi:hypothetical protein